MEKKKDGKTIFLVVMSIATLLVAAIGATFAYFTATVTSTNNVTVEAYKFATTMTIEKTYPESAATYKNLIPIDSTIVEEAADDTNKCVDTNGYMVCQLYTITLSNSGDAVDLDGVIKSTTNDYSNLKFKVLNSSDTAISNAITLATTGGSASMQFSTDATPATSIHIDDGNTTTQTATYKVLVWLEDTSDDQSTEQGSSFEGSVEFTSTTGARLTGVLAQK